MNNIIVILSIVSIQIYTQSIITIQYMPFQKYILQFKKHYSASQQPIRKKIYDQNMKKNIKLAQEWDFITGPNQFTDRTPQQISKLKNNRLQPLLKSVTSHSSINRKLGGPSSLDWRAKGKITSIKDQGFCGSCWAFAAAAYAQSSLIINNGYNNSIDLSEQYLLECTQQSDCKGGFPSYALLTILNHGIPKQEAFPYDPFASNKDICSTRKIVKVKGKQVYVFFSLSDFQMIYLLQSSPIIVGVASEGWQAYQGGIMKCNPNAKEDHAVLLVGYTPQYWIVKNQWGQAWGENGYIRITRNRDYNCLMGAEVDVMYSKIFGSSLYALIALIFLFTF